jgi:hypothetical protein
MHRGPFAPIFGAKAKDIPRSNAMTPTAAAARATPSSAPSLRDRLKDPSLLREQCYIDGV